MASLDRVTEPASCFPDNTGVTLWDLAYEQYVAWDRDGEPTAHVEAYFARLAMLEDPPVLRVA
jgi:hypothetical protein